MMIFTLNIEPTVGTRNDTTISLLLKVTDVEQIISLKENMRLTNNHVFQSIWAFTYKDKCIYLSIN